METFEENIQNKSHTWKEIRKSAKDQMGDDLESLLESYNNKDIGLRLLSEKMEIGEKTLKRVKDRVSTPHHSTFERFYAFFFKTNNSEKVLTETHESIKDYIQTEKHNSEQQSNYELEKSLREDKVFRDIFLYSRTGNITKSWIKSEFGKYGLEVLTMMIKEDVVQEIEKNIFSQGTMGVSKGPDTMKRILGDLVSEHLSAERMATMGDNIGFYGVHRVTEDTKQKVLILSEKFRDDVFSLFDNQKEDGDQRLFVMGAVDNLREIDNDKKVIQ